MNGGWCIKSPKMSVTTLPSLHVGGKVTQQIIKHIPQPPSSKSSSLSKSSRSKKRQNHDFVKFSTSNDLAVRDSKKEDLGKADSFIDTAR